MSVVCTRFLLRVIFSIPGDYWQCQLGIGIERGWNEDYFDWMAIVLFFACIHFNWIGLHFIEVTTCKRDWLRRNWLDVLHVEKKWDSNSLQWWKKMRILYHVYEDFHLICMVIRGGTHWRIKRETSPMDRHKTSFRHEGNTVKPDSNLDSCIQFVLVWLHQLIVSSQLKYMLVSFCEKKACFWRSNCSIIKIKHLSTMISNISIGHFLFYGNIQHQACFIPALFSDVCFWKRNVKIRYSLQSKVLFSLW